MSHHVAARLALGAPLAVAAAGYWATMSPYSQLCGAFPFRSGISEGRPVRTVALTFDDGPNEPFTSQIATYLDERGIKATFFQVGRCVERHPDTTRRLFASGHVIGNHSYAHQFTRCWSEGALTDELRLSQSVFRNALGLDPRCTDLPGWRAPLPRSGCCARPVSIRSRGSSAHALEPLQPSSRRIARRALAKVRPGSIVIFHDGYDARGADRSSTVEAVKVVVDTLLGDGFSFSTIDDLLGIPAYTSQGRSDLRATTRAR